MNDNNVKIGSRILGDSELKKLLPIYKKIFGQINNIREVASNNKRTNDDNINDFNWDKEFDRHYNNIFSILGERGSGKTSVLLTLKHKIIEKYCNDIILPIIVPEQMSDSSDTLGWIIGLFYDVMGNILENIKEEEIEEERRDKYFEHCRLKKNNILKQKYIKLLKQYRYMQNDYKKILLDEYIGFDEYIESSKTTLASDLKLGTYFENFIDELININRNKFNEEPIIFIFFDDVDLNTNRCVEIINIILRYLSQTNIIVFVAGDYNTFSESITINLLRREQLLNDRMEVNYHTNGENALINRQIFTQDLLKKALPPAFRYIMPTLTNEDKYNFSYSTKEANKSYNTLLELLKVCFITKSKSKSKNNFLYYNNKIIEVYFDIFDNKPRGMMNIYYFLSSIYNKRSNIDYDNLKMFLNVIVQSNSKLNIYQNYINKIINIRVDLNESFINYKYISNLVDNDISKEDRLLLFVLANFFENIINIQLKGSKKKVHGTNELWKILNNKKGFSLYPKIYNIPLLLYMYSKINNEFFISSMYTTEDFKVNNYCIENYFKVIEDIKIDDTNYFDFLREIYKFDKLWVEQVIEIIMEYGSGDIIILKNNINRLYHNIKLWNIEERLLNRIGMKLEELLNSLIDKNVKKYLKDNIEKNLGESEYINNANIYYLKLLDFLEDKMLRYENIFKPKLIDLKLKEYIKNIIEIISSNNNMVMIDKDNNIDDKLILMKNILNKSFVTSSELYELESLLNICDDLYYSIISNNTQRYKLEYIKEYLKTLKNRNDDIKEEFIDLCKQYIESKTYINILEKKEDELINNLSKIKIELTNNDGKYVGFKSTILEIEKYSKRVDLS